MARSWAHPDPLNVVTSNIAGMIEGRANNCRHWRYDAGMFSA